MANVGANAVHPFFSPRFEDGTFELLPIPETPSEAGPHSVVFADVPAFNNSGNDSVETLGRWVPERFLGVATHYDPEFTTLTYGDHVGRNARAAALRGVQPGDVLFFIVRLADWTLIVLWVWAEGMLALDGSEGIEAYRHDKNFGRNPAKFYEGWPQPRR